MKSFEEILKNPRLWGYEATPFGYSAWIKLPDCGTCSALWSDREDGWEHVSVSPKKKFNIPTWNDMCIVKDIFWNSEEEAYQIHPKKNQYVNSVNNCLHIWKPIGHEINELLGGIKSDRSINSIRYWNCGWSIRRITMGIMCDKKTKKQRNDDI